VIGPNAQKPLVLEIPLFVSDMSFGALSLEAKTALAKGAQWEHLDKYRDFAAQVREATGGIPIGVKLSAQHIERDIEAALLIGVDYIILDGRGGGTGAAPLIFRDNISVPTIPALARARRLNNFFRASVGYVWEVAS